MDAKSDGVIRLLNEADLVLANLETTLATKGYPAAKHFNFWAKHSVVEDFKRMGIKAMALANNHTMDFDFEGLFETIDVLNENGIASAGAGHCLAEALKPAIIKLGNLRVGFVACSCEVTSHGVATKHRPGLAPLRVNTSININAREQQEFVAHFPSIKMHVDSEDLAELLETLRSIRDKVDIVIVSIHWGQHFQPMVFDYQTEIAHILVDNGADIIMGHSPHVLQGIEIYKGKPIFYSLGHFVFQTNQPSFAPRIGALTDSGLKRGLDNPYRWRLSETAIGKVVFEGSDIESTKIIPVMLDQNGNPTVCGRESNMSILHYLAVISRYLDTSMIVKDDRGFVMARTNT